MRLSELHTSELNGKFSLVLSYVVPYNYIFNVTTMHACAPYGQYLAKVSIASGLGMRLELPRPEVSI